MKLHTQMEIIHPEKPEKKKNKYVKAGCCDCQVGGGIGGHANSLSHVKGRAMQGTGNQTDWLGCADTGIRGKRKLSGER